MKRFWHWLRYHMLHRPVHFCGDWHADESFYEGRVLVVDGVRAVITKYDGTTKTLTVQSWDTDPGDSEVYIARLGGSGG